MFRPVLLLVFVLLAVSGMAQQSSLQGRVSIHNSKYKTGQIQYVPDTYITAFQAKPANSDSQGKFQLTFVRLPPGTSVSVAPEKQGLVVVNSYELERIVVNQKDPVRVFLTSREQLAKAQTELYNISREALFAKKDAMIARLRKNDEDTQKALAELEEFFGHPIEDRFEAETELITRIKELESQLPQYAQDLAKQNLDFASEQYIEAYEFFKLGEVQKAIDVLNEESLEASYEQIKNTRKEAARMDSIRRDLEEKSRLQLRQLIDSYTLKAKAYSVGFRFANAIEQYKKVIDIYEEPDNQLPATELVELYIEIARSLYEEGKYEESLDYFKKAESLQKAQEEDNPVKLADIYAHMGMPLMELGRFKKARSTEQLAVDLLVEAEGDNHRSLITAYGALGVACALLEDYEPALSYHQQALMLAQEKLDSLDHDLSIAYDNIGNTYTDLGEYEKARDYQLKSVAIAEAILDPLHPELAIAYHNLALTYADMGALEKALEYQLKAMEMDEAVLHDKHPALARTYSNIAGTYIDMENLEKAMEFQQKALSIEEEVLDPSHPDLALSYFNLGGIYHELEDYDKSVNYQLKAIKAAEQAKDIDPQDLAICYHNLALTYIETGQYQEALSYQLRALKIDDATLDKNSPDLARSYNNISGTYEGMGEIKKAIQFQKKALDIQAKSLEEIDPELLNSYLRLAHLHLEDGNLKRSRSFRDKLASALDQEGLEDPDSWKTELQELDSKLEEFGKR